MKKIGIAIASFALPLMAAAQGTGTPDLGYFSRLLTQINNLVSMALPIIIAAAVVYFVYGIARYVMSGDDNAKEVAKSKIIYGVIGLFVIISVWGLVRILSKITGVDTAGAPTVSNILPPQ